VPKENQKRLFNLELVIVVKWINLHRLVLPAKNYFPYNMRNDLINRENGLGMSHRVQFSSVKNDFILINFERQVLKIN